MFRRLAARHGRTLAVSPLPPVPATGVAIRLARSSSVGSGPVEEAGLAGALAAAGSATGPFVIEVALASCTLRFEPECKGGQYVQKGYTRERTLMDPVRGAYVVRETTPDRVITWEDCGDQYFLMADVTGRLVARDGDRTVSTVDGALATTAEPYRPKSADVHRVTQAGDVAQALDHFARARRMGASTGSLVTLLKRHWGVPEDVARAALGD